MRAWRRATVTGIRDTGVQMMQRQPHAARRARGGLRALALLALIASGALTGCGQKGPMYLPSQKKTKVPATQPAPAPAASPAAASPG